MILNLFLYCFIPLLNTLEIENPSVLKVFTHYPGNANIDIVLNYGIINSRMQDTTKSPIEAGKKTKYFVISGSFLIPKNAENQVAKLQKLGFNKTFKYNFPESEFYSAVVDTFYTTAAYAELIEKLKKNNVGYFIKNY